MGRGGRCVARVAPWGILWGIGAGAGAVGLSAGCAADPSKGYSTRSTFGEGIRTVSVPVFDNYTGAPGVEVELTEAVIKELQRTGGVRVVGAGDAQTRLTGVVTGARLATLSVERTTGLVQEQSYQVTVDFDWKDGRSGETLVSRRGFSATDTFVPARPSAERLEVGQHGAISRLARDLVAELRSTW